MKKRCYFSSPDLHAFVGYGASEQYGYAGLCTLGTSVGVPVPDSLMYEVLVFVSNPVVDHRPRRATDLRLLSRVMHLPNCHV